MVYRCKHAILLFAWAPWHLNRLDEFCNSLLSSTFHKVFCRKFRAVKGNCTGGIYWTWRGGLLECKNCSTANKAPSYLMIPPPMYHLHRSADHLHPHLTHTHMRSHMRASFILPTNPQHASGRALKPAHNGWRLSQLVWECWSLTVTRWVLHHLFHN